MAGEDRALLAFRTVQAATVGALLWKLTYLVQIAKVYFELPLHQRFFPPFFSSATTFAASYAAAVIGAGLMLATPHAWVRRAFAWITLLGLSILCLHQGSYNDATFTTAWWVTLWSVWFAGRMGRGDQALLHRGARLSRAILALVFLGGAAGKWTPEYWSGQVLYEIYFVDRDFWLFNSLRANYEPEMLRQIATWYSRQVIVVETLCGLTLWALPARVAAIVGAGIFTLIAVFSNFFLFSVVLSLIGLALVGLFVPATGQRFLGNDAVEPELTQA